MFLYHRYHTTIQTSASITPETRGLVANHASAIVSPPRITARLAATRDVPAPTIRETNGTTFARITIGASKSLNQINSKSIPRALRIHVKTLFSF